jgi:hypothetical protein
LSLEETAALFDGESALEHIARKAGHEVEGSPRDVKEDIDEKGSGTYSPEKA